MTGTAGRPGKIVALLLVPAAVAIAGVLLVMRLQLEPPTVPVYALVGDGRVASVRRGARFELTLAPASPAAGAIGARAFLVRGDEVRPWTAPYSVGLDGTVTIAGSAAELFEGVPAGEWEVAVAVGRPETLPTAPRDILRARQQQLQAGADAGSADAAWRLVRQRITVDG